MYVEPCSVKVTRIKDRWHVRLYYLDKVYDEIAVEYQQDIAYASRYMLRWFDKCGGDSKFATAARSRLNKEVRGPVGKVWYKPHYKTKGEK